ncbi:MAG TPA: hypothetical protein ENJ80_12555 [Gammaproteobacteria bacterium]|nr:hypothetical protein [Gammaproteobacteria bacterium]
MGLTICKKICKECPFSTSSPKGWLGPHSLEGVLDAQQRGKLFSCHMLRKDEMSSEDIESGEVRICRGFIASASKSGIAFDQDSKTGKALKGLQELVAREAKEDNSTILSRQEFEKHHGGHLPGRAIPKADMLRRLGYRI